MAEPTNPDPNTPNLRSPFLVLDNFLPIDVAMAMRKHIDGHFANAHSHKPETHQIWNYWFVPELYTYLRTQPEKIMPMDQVQAFLDHFRGWSSDKLGMERISWPYLSMYVNGCQQRLHNDSANGRFGFAYSLTRNTRKTSGGRTLIMHEGDHFRSKLTHATAGQGFYSAIEPAFNRLVIFDDRMPHAVDRVEGSMDPVEGRFVLHGHISESGLNVAGALTASQAQDVVTPRVDEFLKQCSAGAWAYHGPLILRIHVAQAGDVTSYKVLVDRVASPLDDRSRWEARLLSFLNHVVHFQFPAAPGPTTITLPVMLGPPLS